MDLSECRHVGDGPWEVPQMGLGCFFLGDPCGPTDEGLMQETLKTARGEGIRYFDTKSEHRLGYFLSCVMNLLSRPRLVAFTIGQTILKVFQPHHGWRGRRMG